MKSTVLTAICIKERRYRSRLFALLAVFIAVCPAMSGASLLAAVLPADRSVEVGNTATALATLINTATSTATGCSIAPLTSVPADFSYQATDPATNALTGTPDTPVDIAAGALQTFLFAFTPSAPFNPTVVALSFDCSNTAPATTVTGLNTFRLSASSVPVPDVIALAATLENDGIVHIPDNPGTGVFAVAAINIGSIGTVIVSGDTGTTVLPININVCETNPTDGACFTPPAASITTQINTGATPTFAVFVEARDNVPLDPANNRVFVRFKDSGNVTRGSTSVAVEGGLSVGGCVDISGRWNATETVTFTCTILGGTETDTQSGSGATFITQNACDISYPAIGANITRTGVVDMNRVTITGPFLISLDPSANVNFSHNLATATGTVAGNQIDLMGTGSASGTIDGFPFNCTGTSTASFTR